MSKLILAVTCTIWIICCVMPAGAAPPAVSFNYQGKLLSNGGEPVADGSYTLAAGIYAVDTGGTALWSGSYTAQVTGGVFSTIIGPVSTDILSTVESRWLQVTINGSTLSPRTKLVSVPYAGVAAVAASVTSGSVTSSSIADGGVGLVDLTGTGATADYILKRNGTNTAWVFAPDSDTVYSAGAGLNLASGAFSIADSGVTSAKIEDGGVALVDLTGAGAAANYVIKRNSTNTAWTFAPDSSATYTAAGGLSLIGSAFSIADSGVTTASIADSAVTSLKIKDLTVGTGDIAAGAVTTAKISSTGATTGKALMYDGTSIVWGNPAADSIVLPYTGSTSGADDAFSVTTTGTGRAGYFEADNASTSTANALEAKANTTGYALYASTTGIATAVKGYASGTGIAGVFQIENSANYVPALQSQTDGHGVAIKGLSTGDGNAGDFQISNAASAAVGVKSATNGIGKAGLFQITNSANASDTVYASTSGGGSAVKGYTTGTSYAGEFQITNSANNTNAVYAITNGTGSAIKGYTTGTNRAGEFQLANSSSGADALYAITNGYGNAVTGSAVSGSGGYFTGSAASSRAVFGSATNSGSGYNYGGYFLAAGVNGSGVYGAATGTTAASYGGDFQTASSIGSGVHARNTGSGTQGALAGPDYGVKATGDLVVTGDARVSGDLVVTGSMPFPRPAYNSGWVHLEQGTYTTLNHNVGGDTDDYVVDMQLKSVDGVINNIGIGRDSNSPYYDGAAYYVLSNSQLWIQRYDTDQYAHYIRIRIWVCN